MKGVVVSDLFGAMLIILSGSKSFYQNLVVGQFDV